MNTCEICGKVLDNKFCREALDWDWFTGYLPRTVHFCPEHKASSVAKELFNKSQVKPIGVPKELHAKAE
jgi:hypothetical protein